MPGLLDDMRHEFRRYKGLADRAMSTLDDGAFMARPGASVNPVALIVKHLGGNLASRWTDFLTTDGEKPSRDRDGEFHLREQDTRASLMKSWENGWRAVLTTLDDLKDEDLDKVVSIRGEPHTVCQALLRGLAHTSYHVGQILYLARLWRPDSTWLTVAPGQSRKDGGNYRSPA